MNFEMKHHNKLFDFHPSIVNRFNNTLDFSFESQNTESPIGSNIQSFGSFRDVS